MLGLNYLPKTVRVTKKLIKGCVFTWHSYRPSSANWASLICSIQSSDRSMFTATNLSSAVYVFKATVNTWKSRLRIQETCKENINYFQWVWEGMCIDLVIIHYMLLSAVRPKMVLAWLKINQPTTPCSLFFKVKITLFSLIIIKVSA